MSEVQEPLDVTVARAMTCSPRLYAGRWYCGCDGEDDGFHNVEEDGSGPLEPYSTAGEGLRYMLEWAATMELEPWVHYQDEQWTACVVFDGNRRYGYGKAPGEALARAIVAAADAGGEQ